MEYLKLPTLVAVTGLPGCGKTTVIGELRGLVHLEYLDTDSCWKTLYENPRYTPEESQVVFEHLLGRARLFVAADRSTVTEGVFASYERIKRLRQAVDFIGRRFLVVGVRCDWKTAEVRMIKRHQVGGNAPVPETLWWNLYHKLAEWEDGNNVHWINSAEMAPTEAAKLIAKLIL